MYYIKMIIFIVKWKICLYKQGIERRIIMHCKFCQEKMEFDSSEGIGHSEVHHYECIMCESSVTVHENGEEDTWESGEK